MATGNYDAAQERHSIYFEFDDFTSSTPACPIVQYKVVDLQVIYPLHDTESLNYKYGRRDDSGTAKYVYEAGTTATHSGVGHPSICESTGAANFDA